MEMLVMKNFCKSGCYYISASFCIVDSEIIIATESAKANVQTIPTLQMYKKIGSNKKSKPSSLIIFQSGVKTNLLKGSKLKKKP